MLLDQIAEQVKKCTKCGLCATRTNTVFSSGAANAALMFIGEAPGTDEDQQGAPFVGASGKRLDAMIAKCFGLQRSDVYVANIIKCRPPNNRPPAEDEIVQCFGYLQQQILLVQPKVIVTLGRVATQTLLAIKDPITKIRGKQLEYNGTIVVPTTHPSYWLRKPSDTLAVVDDMRLAAALLSKDSA
jgi:uracil-DNA glycosylase family 4